LASTKYIISFWINKKEQENFAAAVRKYNNRETLSHTYQVEIMGQREITAGSEKYSQDYIDVDLACTDALALFKFGEFWGNKTMQRWEREHREQTKGGLSNG
jgi:hypothetical protein